ncbi:MULTISPECIES: hypothetical protein [unclassified Marinobacter]|uniref:hypothetical protein n=1 Tax=unclassified Marinobacter TaxID=83889 RepID=UPI0012680DCB|nr:MULTISPECIES: hypothetical protein [unclassified Marinobacter]
MTAVRKGVRGLAVLSSVTLLAACGGGGGGGSDGPDLTLDNDNLAEQTVEVGPESDVRGILGLYDDVDYGSELIVEVQDILATQSGGVSGTTDCDGGGTATVTYAGADDNSDETWTLQGCVVNTSGFGAVTLNGDYRYVDTLTETSIKGFETYNINGQVQSGEGAEQLLMRGRVDFDYSGTEDSARFIDTISVFELKIGERYVAVTDGETRLIFNGSEAEYSNKAKLIGSAIGGYIQLTTPVVVEFVEGQECPVAGVFRVASNGTAEIRFGTSTGGTGVVAIWIDNQLVESYDNCSEIGVVPAL